MALSTATFDDDVYEIPAGVLEEMQSPWVRSPLVTPATCMLAAAVRCPHCTESIRSVHVVGLGRAEAVNGSTALLRSLVVVCPACEGTVPAKLTGL